MAKYEYQIIHQLANRVDHLTRQLNAAVEDGWEPASVTGDQTVFILLRRPKQEPTGSTAEASRDSTPSA